MHKRCSTLRSAVGAVEQRADRCFALVGCKPVSGQFQSAEDAAEQVVEVVRDAPRQLPYGFDLLRLAQRFLGLLALRHGQFHALFELCVEVLQGAFSALACRHVTKDHRNLMIVSRLNTDCRKAQAAFGGQQLVLEIQGFAGALHRTEIVEPDLGLVGDHFTQGAAHHIGQPGMAAVSGVGHQVHVIAQWPQRAVDELDDAEAFFHVLEQESVTFRLLGALMQPR
ncbi:hypothetical protein D3C80_1131540 [compost metagenome]